MLYIKQVTLLGVFVTLVGLEPAARDNLSFRYVPPAIKPPGLTEHAIPPYVSSEDPVPFIDAYNCKSIDNSKPVLEQLNQCQAQRLGWLKI